MKTVYLFGLISTEVPQSLEWRTRAAKLLRRDAIVLSPLRGKEDLNTRTDDGGITSTVLTSTDIVLRDFNDIMRADLLLGNLDNFGGRSPVGTYFELGWAWYFRKPVIAIASAENYIARHHPFICQAVAHYFEQLEAAVEFARYHYLR